MANPEKVSRTLQFRGGHPVQVVYGSGVRVVATAGVASSAEAALPTGAKLIEVRAAGGDIWIRFGNTGMGAAAADANSILFPAGEKLMPVPLDASGVLFDFFRVLRVGADDVPVQIERIEVVAT